MVRCGRCETSCVIKTSWTDRNPGRRFYGCPRMVRFKGFVFN